MFVVTIKRWTAPANWVQCASYVIKETQVAERAMYEALYRWLQDDYHGSALECLKALKPADVQVAIFSGDALGQLELVEQKRIVLRTQWCLGRNVSESPVHCAACDWYGPMMQMMHRYRLNSKHEIEPADYCPACGAPLS